MKWFQRYWYDLGLGALVVVALVMVLTWRRSSTLEKLALANLGAILWHQFEEYHFPGGEPAIMNLAMNYQEGGQHDRAPLNQKNAMVINVGGDLFYLLPCLFPRVGWLAFAPVAFGLAQVLGHVAVTPKLVGNHFYTPGALATVCGHLPIGIAWFTVTIKDGLLDWGNALGGLVYLVCFIGLFMRKFGYEHLASTADQDAFGEDEFERGGYAARIRLLKQEN